MFVKTPHNIRQRYCGRSSAECFYTVRPCVYIHRGTLYYYIAKAPQTYYITIIINYTHKSRRGVPVIII